MKVQEVMRKTIQDRSTIITGLELNVVTYKGSVHTLDGDNATMKFIAELYEGPMDNTDDIMKLFKAFGKVEKAVKVNKGYHVFIGKSFFTTKSGYKVIMKANGKIESCEYVLKLAK